MGDQRINVVKSLVHAMDYFVCMVIHPQLEITAGGSVSGTQPPTQYLND
jgi:hypothetical protein